MAASQEEGNQDLIKSENYHFDWYLQGMTGLFAVKWMKSVPQQAIATFQRRYIDVNAGLDARSRSNADEFKRSASGGASNAPEPSSAGFQSTQPASTTPRTEIFSKPLVEREKALLISQGALIFVKIATLYTNIIKDFVMTQMREILGVAFSDPQFHDRTFMMTFNLAGDAFRLLLQDLITNTHDSVSTGTHQAEQQRTSNILTPDDFKSPYLLEDCQGAPRYTRFRKLYEVSRLRVSPYTATHESRYNLQAIIARQLTISIKTAFLPRTALFLKRFLQRNDTFVGKGASKYWQDLVIVFYHLLHEMEHNPAYDAFAWTEDSSSWTIDRAQALTSRDFIITFKGRAWSSHKPRKLNDPAPLIPLALQNGATLKDSVHQEDLLERVSNVDQDGLAVNEDGDTTSEWDLLGEQRGKGNEDESMLLAEDLTTDDATTRTGADPTEEFVRKRHTQAFSVIDKPYRCAATNMRVILLRIWLDLKTPKQHADRAPFEPKQI